MTPNLHARDAAKPTLVWGRVPAQPRIAVLVLHGGKVASRRPVVRWQLSVLRMVPFARAIRRARPDAVVVRLRYAVAGWNGADESPVADARWALARIAGRYGQIPVVLVGHSMGGRTAAAIANDRAVTGIVGLAPWWPTGSETDRMRPSQRLLVLHGTLDRWTDPERSRAATERAAKRGVDASWLPMHAAGHFMLIRPWVWTRKVLSFFDE